MMIQPFRIQFVAIIRLLGWFIVVIADSPIQITIGMQFHTLTTFFVCMVIQILQHCDSSTQIIHFLHIFILLYRRGYFDEHPTNQFVTFSKRAVESNIFISAN